MVHSIVVGIICSVLTPYMLNPSAWDWANFAGFFWVSFLYPLRMVLIGGKGLTYWTGRNLLPLHCLYIL